MFFVVILFFWGSCGVWVVGSCYDELKALSIIFPLILFITTRTRTDTFNFLDISEKKKLFCKIGQVCVDVTHKRLGVRKKIFLQKCVEFIRVYKGQSQENPSYTALHIKKICWRGCIVPPSG